MAVTDNRNLQLPTVGGSTGVWGTLLNGGVMAQLDLLLGATQAKAITIADVTLSIPEWNNCAIKLTGVLTGNRSLILPFNANSATVAVGGIFVVQNDTTGAFNVTVKTQAAGSVGVVVPRGVRTLLYSDTVNVYYADDASLHIIPYAGNPNGFVAGTAATVANPPSMVWDYSNGVMYACTTSGIAAVAVWTNIVASSAPLPTPQGYLTTVSNTPIITADSISVTDIYYTPFVGTWAAAHNGSAIIAYQFSQMRLALTASQAAGNIYDVFLAFNGGVPVIGTGPSWSAGGGSVAPGSGARGTGAGSTQISRASPSGLWVNTVSMSLIWNTGSGNTTIVVGAGEGIFLGSVAIDAVAGQTTCHRTVGQSRIWGVSNAYNAVENTLLVTDPTASWSQGVTTVQPANDNTANSLTFLNCLISPQVDIFTLHAFTDNVGGRIGIGWNSTSAFSGTEGALRGEKTTIPASYTPPPFIGTTVVTALEAGGGSANTMYGTIANFVLGATFMA